ncbi:hypothetical protein B1A_14456, partial [mine drainage metagenome]
MSKQRAIVREVAVAGAAEAYFAQSHYPSDSSTPLQPYTGDGPLCDVLMLEAGRGADQPVFERITEWFVWLCLRYHQQTLTSASYSNYLDGEESSGNRLNREDAGGPISAAGCQIRKLADPDQQGARDALLSLGLELTDDHGRHLARLAHQVHRITTIGASDVKDFARRAKLSEGEAREQLESMRYRVHGTIRHVLRLTWRLTEQGDGVSRERVRDAQRDYSRPRVRRYGGLREEVRVDDPDDGNSGVAIDFYGPESSPTPRPRLPRDAWDDEGEDPDGSDGDPLYQIYIGRTGDDPVASYYAAKGRRYAVEYENAQLSWSRNRLGRDALLALTRALPLS